MYFNQSRIQKASGLKCAMQRVHNLDDWLGVRMLSNNLILLPTVKENNAAGLQERHLLVGAGGCVLVTLNDMTIIPHKCMYDPCELDGIAHRDTINPQHFHLSDVGGGCSQGIAAHHF